MLDGNENPLLSSLIDINNLLYTPSHCISISLALNGQRKSLGPEQPPSLLRWNFYKLGEFVSRFLLGCIKLTCYVLLKKGTLYVYDSKRSCLNNPQQPKLFFNLNVTKICRTGHFLRFEDPFTTLTLWSALEEEVSMLE